MIGKLRSTVMDCRAPQFPDPRGSQQFHLDIAVDDVDRAERDVLALRATRVTDVVEASDQPLLQPCELP